MENTVFNKMIKWFKRYVFVKIDVPETLLMFVVALIVFLYVFFDNPLLQSIYIFFSGSLYLFLLYKYMTKKYKSFFEAGIVKKQYMYQMMAGSLFLLILSVLKYIF